MNVTKTQLMAGFAVLQAVAEAVRNAGSVSEGSLYAVLMGKMDLPAFERMLGCLVGAGLVVRDHNLHTVRWIGPAV